MGRAENTFLKMGHAVSVPVMAWAFCVFLYYQLFIQSALRRSAAYVPHRVKAGEIHARQ
jgi:hypothetical protein